VNQEIKERWVAALESGEFQQGTNFLAMDSVVMDEITGREAVNEDGSLKLKRRYCCLGVLCEVAKRDGAIDSYDIAEPYLPRVVQEWAELPTRPAVPNRSVTADDPDSVQQAAVNLDGERVGLDILNDNGCTFPRIAELIRAHL
jgi:hypothetical protein